MKLSGNKLRKNPIVDETQIRVNTLKTNVFVRGRILKPKRNLNAVVIRRGTKINEEIPNKT